MKKFALSLLVAMNMISYTAVADEQFVGANKFYDLIQVYKAACKDSECVKPYREMPIYANGVRSAFLSKQQFKKLEKIAIKQAYIWADTVLEGDFHADGETVLESVTAIFQATKLIAYKIDYSEHAWYVGECDWDGSDNETLADCPEGKIHESSYVAPDFKTFIRNDDDIADFYN